MKIVFVVLAVLASYGAAVYFWPFNRPRYRFLPPIAVEHYRCAACGSLEGGIYGKGPFRRFRSPKATWCIHKWRSLSREEFMARALNEFKTDLATAPWRTLP